MNKKGIPAGQGFKMLLILLLLTAGQWQCLKSKRPGLPEEVRETLALSGIHKPRLLMALEPYVESPDTLKRLAMYYIIANMKANYTVRYHVQDTLGHIYRFNPMSYPDYLSLKHRWDSIERQAGNLIYEPDTFLLDYEEIGDTFLIKNQEEAFNAWRNFPWSKKYGFRQFLNWILPYRCANETVEPFREHFQKLFLRRADSLKSENPLTVAQMVNELINSKIDYKDNFNKEADVQTVRSLEKNRFGNFYDIAVYKVKALRSLGIAAALDYTPFLADTNFGCAWATAFDEKGGEFYLFPNTTVKNLFKPGRMAKTYRRTFETLDSSLRALKNVKTATPPFLGHWDYLDITNPLYAAAISVTVDEPCRFAYLAVFNDGEWHPVDWALVDSAGRARFKKMAVNVVYLPVRMKKHKMYRMNYPFIAEQGGTKHFLIPDASFPVNVVLKKTAPHSDMKKGTKYTLYVWNGNWQPLSGFYYGGAAVSLTVPRNGLFLLSDDNIDFEERIFITDPLGKQLFY